MNMMTLNPVFAAEVASKIVVKTKKLRVKDVGFNYKGHPVWRYLSGPNAGREFIYKDGAPVFLPVQQESVVAEVKDVSTVYPRTEWYGGKRYILNSEREWNNFQLWCEEQETARRLAEEVAAAAKVAQKPKPFLPCGIWYDDELYQPRNERELAKLHLFIEEVEAKKVADEAARIAWESRPGAFRRPKKVVRTVGKKTNVGAGTDKGPTGGGKPRQTSNPKKAAAIARKAAQRKK